MVKEKIIGRATNKGLKAAINNRDRRDLISVAN